MSRAKCLQLTEVCGDCGAIEATWASLNKGILLCTECCSIHRSLGRHISQVKSLQKSIWPGKQLTMLMTLNNNGVNSIWEHALLENGSKLLKKKPNPKDSLEVKIEFIKAKHQHCSFAFRQNYEDGPICVENELGKQLHASVRAVNLETSFRLLAIGADPNYFHDEKGTTPLHVAVKKEQYLQIELLLVYGADPTCPDAHGNTSIDYAKKKMNNDIYNRLIENQYEVTDCLSYYLAMRKPDHLHGVHFLLPQNGFYPNSNSVDKLQKLPNHLFEELTIDVFDEVDRRQTEAIWLSCVDAIDLNTVPFLPVDPTLSTTRNQGRQKLARFSTPELKNLVFDILADTQKREILSMKSQSMVVDDDPVYDSVASDEDYAVLPSIEEKNTSNAETDCLPTKKDAALIKLTKQLKVSDSTILDLKAEVSKLKAYVESLASENNNLRSKLSKLPELARVNGETGYRSLDTILMNQCGDSRVPINGQVPDENSSVASKGQRPSSMYETRDILKGGISNWQIFKHKLMDSDQRRGTVQGLCSEKYSRQPFESHISNITKTVQQLCRSLNGPNIDECIRNAEKVKIATAKLIANLPKDLFADITKNMLDVLPRLQPECREYVATYKQGDKTVQDHHLTNIREYAYILARSTRDIAAKSSLF